MTILTGSTVVIAEPYASVALGLQAIIGQWGGACRTVRSSTELRAVLRSAPPDLLLVNVDLVGGTEGVDALSRLYPVRIVAMVAGFLPRDGRDTVTYLEMPFTMPDLKRAVAVASPRLSASPWNAARWAPNREPVRNV